MAKVVNTNAPKILPYSLLPPRFPGPSPCLCVWHIIMMINTVFSQNFVANKNSILSQLFFSKGKFKRARAHKSLTSQTNEEKLPQSSVLFLASLPAFLLSIPSNQPQVFQNDCFWVLANAFKKEVSAVARLLLLLVLWPTNLLLMLSMVGGPCQGMGPTLDCQTRR